MKKSLTVKQQNYAAIVPPDSPEYRIAVTQLEKLEEIAKARLFSADEARLYDILCKSLSLVREAPLTSTTTYKGNITISEKDLIGIAREVEDFEKLANEDLNLVKEDQKDGKETSE